MPKLIILNEAVILLIGNEAMRGVEILESELGDTLINSGSVFQRAKRNAMFSFCHGRSCSQGSYCCSIRCGTSLWTRCLRSYDRALELLPRTKWLSATLKLNSILGTDQKLRRGISNRNANRPDVERALRSRSRRRRESEPDRHYLAAAPGSRPGLSEHTGR